MISMTQVYVLIILGIIALLWDHQRSKALARQTQALFEEIVLRSEHALGPHGYELVSKEYQEASFGHRRAELCSRSAVVEAFLDNRDAELIISRYSAATPLREQQPLARVTVQWPRKLNATEAYRTVAAAERAIIEVATA